MGINVSIRTLERVPLRKSLGVLAAGPFREEEPSSHQQQAHYISSNYKGGGRDLEQVESLLAHWWRKRRRLGFLRPRVREK